MAGHHHDGRGTRAGYRGSAVEASPLSVFEVDERSLSNGLEIEQDDFAFISSDACTLGIGDARVTWIGD
jgi:hypothetical protein